jgi:hypothetical protein
LPAVTAAFHAHVEQFLTETIGDFADLFESDIVLLDELGEARHEFGVLAGLDVDEEDVLAVFEVL